MQKIVPFLWFNDQAEEAVNFYISVFNNSAINKIMKYDAEGAKVSGKPEGSIMTIAFELEEQKFMALNGGPQFSFSGAISFLVNCDSQEEIDKYWEKLSEGGEKQQCGWLKDKFGVPWQVVPANLDSMLDDEDPQKSKRVMMAMLKMKKIDMNMLKEAYEGN